MSEEAYQAEPRPEKTPDFKPLGTYILVWVDADSAVTEGGLFKPSTAKERPDTGEIIAIGDEVVTLRPGDRISFTKYAGKRITLDGNDYSIMKEAEVYGVYGRGL